MKRNTTLTLCLLILLAGGHHMLMSQTMVGQTITSTEELDGTGDAVAISGEGHRIIIGTSYNIHQGPQGIGYAAVYELIDSFWVQVGEDIKGEEPTDQFGNAVCISQDGNRVVVGGSKGAIVYDLINSVWEQVGARMQLSGIDTIYNRLDQIRISEDKNTVVLAGISPGSDIAVYTYDNGNWVQKGNDLPEDSDKLVALSADGNRLAFYAQNSMGFSEDEVRVFEYDGHVWVPMGNPIQLPNGFQWSEGFDLSGDGTRIVLSLENNDGSANGAASTYEFIEGQWTRVGPLLDLTVFTSYGTSLRLSYDGNTFVFSNSYDLSVVDQTTVEVYRFADQNWTRYGEILPGAAHDDTADGQVDINADGNRIVMGGVKSGPKDFRGFAKVFSYEMLVSSEKPAAPVLANVFPNPASDRVTITHEESFHTPLTVQLFSTNGVWYAEHRMVGRQLELRLPDQPGLYFLQLISDNGSRSVQKIIKYE